MSVPATPSSASPPQSSPPFETSLRMKSSVSNFDAGSLDYRQKSLLFASTEPIPQLQSRGSRMHLLGKKLAFWRKGPTNTSDVYYAIRRLVNSHDAYRNDLQNACSTLREWTEYLAPPSMISEDLLQYQLTDTTLSQWLDSVLDTIKPVVENERKFNDIYTALCHTFEVLKQDEALCKSAISKQNSAERRFFKAMASQYNEQETMHLNNERSRLVAEVEHATDRFHRTSRREIPLRFRQLKVYYDQFSRESSRASKSIERLLAWDFTPSTPSSGDPRDHSPPSEYNEPVSLTPPYSMPFSVDPLSAPQFPGTSYAPGKPSSETGDGASVVWT